ncbi:MAG: CAP domain-containing protein [Isosphaeraceae bacterium]
MNHTIRGLIAVLLAAAAQVSLISAPALAQQRSDRRPTMLADSSLKNADLVILDRNRPAMPEPERNPGRPQRPVSSIDPYGFGSILNNYRASAGLPPVAYDVELSAWASQNNAAQNSYGLGHHVNPGCLQNSGWNYSDASSLAVGWINSPAHRDTLLSRTITRFGIAYGPGPYWTLNAR